MNIVLRKLAMLEKSMREQEERSLIEGYTTCPIDRDLQKRVSDLMDKVRTV